MAQLGAVSNLRGIQRGQEALANMIAISPFLRAMDAIGGGGWQEGPLNNDFHPVNPSLTLQARNLDGSYSSLAITPEAKQTDTQRFHGFQIDVDQAHLADDARGLMPLASWFPDQLKEEVQQFGRLFEKGAFQGTGAGTPTVLKGLGTILDGTTDLQGYTGVKGVINGEDYDAGQSFDLTVIDAATANQFLEALELWAAEVEGANVMFCHPKLGAKIGSMYRMLHGNPESRDMFGQKIDVIASLPLVRLLKETVMLTEANADESATDTTSLYIVNLGENLTSMMTNSGLEYEEYDMLQDKQSGREKGEIRSNWRLKRKDCIRRVRHLKV